MVVQHGAAITNMVSKMQPLRLSAVLTHHVLHHLPTQPAPATNTPQGRAIKYLGSSCHPDVCDDGCSSDHQFYRARVMPPQLPQQGQPSLPGQAEAISQAHAAASGRPVLLILDLHTRLRCSGFAQMLQMAAEQLQVGVRLSGLCWCINAVVQQQGRWAVVHTCPAGSIKPPATGSRCNHH